jgi:NADH-quinone oxidoreductase subunit N
MGGLTLNPSEPLVLEGGLFGLLLAVFVLGLFRRNSEEPLAGWVTLAGLIGLSLVAWAAQPGRSALEGSFVLDELSLFVKRLFLAASVLSVLATLAMTHVSFRRRGAEYHVALLGSLLGMLVLASARDLILLFVAFELMSIPLYFLTGFLKADGQAPEGAMKFFLVGSISSAVILYGISFVYGSTGTTDIGSIPAALSTFNPLMLLGLGLALAGLGFKIAAVPFHMWVPDTYQAANTPFVAWISVAPKAAGFVAIFRLYLEGVGPAAQFWVPLIAALATISVIAGNLMAIPQTNIKRLLAYSGIAHIGYLLLGLAAMSVSGVAMVLFYLAAYLFGNMGAFFVVQAVAGSEQSDEIEAYQGLARRSPALALCLLLFLLSLGGIPFMAGFWAKLFVFWAVVEQGLLVLAFIGAVMTVVALYYYLVVARRMYIETPVRLEPIPVAAPLMIAIATCVAGILVMGVYPGPWVRACIRVAATLFGAN